MRLVVSSISLLLIFIIITSIREEYIQYNNKKQYLFLRIMTETHQFYYAGI